MEYLYGETVRNMQTIYVKPWCSFIKKNIFALKSLLPIHFYNCFVYSPTIVDEIK